MSYHSDMTVNRLNSPRQWAKIGDEPQANRPVVRWRCAACNFRTSNKHAVCGRCGKAKAVNA